MIEDKLEAGNIKFEYKKMISKRKIEGSICELKRNCSAFESKTKEILEGGDSSSSNIKDICLHDF